MNTCGPLEGSSVIVNLDGTVVGGAGLHPVWSPDGKRIVSDWGGVCSDEACYVAAVSDGDDLGEAGHRRTRLDPGVRLPADVCLQYPLWSGRWIAASTTTCNPDLYFDSLSTLYVFRVAGANVRRVRALAGVEVSVWSPDGSRLAFRHRDSLLLARGDGSHARRFATHAPTHGSRAGRQTADRSRSASQAGSLSPAGTGGALGRSHRQAALPSGHRTGTRSHSSPKAPARSRLSRRAADRRGPLPTSHQAHSCGCSVGLGTAAASSTPEASDQPRTPTQTPHVCERAASRDARSQAEASRKA